MLRILLFPTVAGTLLVANLALADPPVSPRDSSWTRTEYSTFRTLDVDDVQLRLCYVGGWISPFLSMRITSRPLPIDAQYTSPYLASVAHCDDARIEIRVPRQRLATLIDSLGTIPGLVDGHIEGKAGVSLVLATRASTHHRSFEAILEPTQNARVMHFLLSILGDDPAILDDLTEVGCQLGMASDERAVDVTRLVSTRIGRVTHVRRSNDVTCAVTVKNRSGVPIQGPLDVTITARPNISLLERSGTTCVTGRSYREEYTRLLWKGALLPGKTVTGRIRLANSDDETVMFDEPRVLAGPGSR